MTKALKLVGVALGSGMVAVVIAWAIVIIGAVAAGKGNSRMPIVLPALAISVGLVFAASGIPLYLVAAKELESMLARLAVLGGYGVVMLGAYALLAFSTLVLLNR